MWDKQTEQWHHLPRLAEATLSPSTLLCIRQAKRTKLEMKIAPPPPATSRYSKTLGKYNINIKTPNINIKTPNILGGGGRSPSASPPRGRSPPASPVRGEPPDLGTLSVSMRYVQ